MVRFVAKQLCFSELEFLFSGVYVSVVAYGLLGSNRHTLSLTAFFSVTFYRQPTSCVPAGPLAPGCRAAVQVTFVVGPSWQPLSLL